MQPLNLEIRKGTFLFVALTNAKFETSVYAKCNRKNGRAPYKNTVGMCKITPEVRKYYFKPNYRPYKVISENKYAS